MGSFRAADLGRGRLRQRRHQRPPAPFHHVIDPLSQPGGFSAAGRADHPELVGPHLSFPHPCQLILRGGLPAPESVSPSPVLHLPARAGFPQAPLRRDPGELRRPPVEKSPYIFTSACPPARGGFFGLLFDIFGSRVYIGTDFFRLRPWITWIIGNSAPLSTKMALFEHKIGGLDNWITWIT